MKRVWWWLAAVAMVITVICCFSSVLLYREFFVPSPVPTTFKETDLVGTWQATYGTPQTTDTITLRVDGTYQQIFQSPESNYHYESPWNEWYVEYTADQEPKLHLKGMRYCVGPIYRCEVTGQGEPFIYYDFVDRKYIELTDEVILRITGDEKSLRGIRLWNLSTDEDNSPEFFTLINE